MNNPMTMTKTIACKSRPVLLASPVLFATQLPATPRTALKVAGFARTINAIRGIREFTSAILILV
jgi:hypothetical protein